MKRFYIIMMVLGLNVLFFACTPQSVNDNSPTACCGEDTNNPPPPPTPPPSGDGG